MGALICAGALVAGCASDGEPEPTATVTATETVTATPEPEPLSADEAWLEEMREDHIDGLADWWAEYFERDCDASDAECYELFEAGLDPLEDFRSDLVNTTDDLPGFVPIGYGGELGITVARMEDWSVLCPDRNGCEDLATSAEESVVNVLVQAVRWPDES